MATQTDEYTFGIDGLLTLAEVVKHIRLSPNPAKALLSINGGPIEARRLENGRGDIRVCRRSMLDYLATLSEAC